MKRSFLATVLFSMFRIYTAMGQVNPDFKPDLQVTPTIWVMKEFSNGKIFVGGSITKVQGVSMRGGAMLTGDGMLDNTFSTEVINPGGNSNRTLYDMVYDAGIDAYYVAFQNEVMRLRSDGTLDESFAPILQLRTIVHLGLQSDGKLIVISVNTRDFGIVRFNTDGSLDESFANGVGFDNATQGVMKVLNDDKIVVGGVFSSYNNVPQSNLIRLNPDGSVDTSFDFQGAITNSDVLRPSIRSIVPLDDGDMVISGTFDTLYGNPAKSIGRLNADGSLDEAFSLSSELSDLIVFCDPFAIRYDSESIVVAARQPDLQRLNVFRIANDGSLDPTFQVGHTEHSLSLGSCTKNLVLNDSNEVYFSGEFTSYNGHFSQGLVRLGPDGKVDINYDSDISFRPSIRNSRRLNDGSTVLIGRFTKVNNEPITHLVKLLPDGTIDQDFMEAVGTGPDLFINAIEIDSEENIILGGNFRYFNNELTFGLVKLRSDGTKDPDFVGSATRVNDIQITNADSIFISGSFSTVNSNGINGLAKLDKNGVLDTEFNASLPSRSQIEDLRLFPNGDLLYAGLIATGERPALIGKIGSNGSTLDFNADYDFTEQEIYDITIMPETEEIIISNRVSRSVFSKIIRLSSKGEFIDDEAISVLGLGGVRTFLPIDSNNLIMCGDFGSINGILSPGLAKVSLDGNVDDDYNTGMLRGDGFDPSVLSITDLGDENFLISGSFVEVYQKEVSSVAIVKINRSPTVPDFSFDVTENSGASTVVGTVGATDPNGDVLSYSIESGNGLESFQIDPESGTLSVANSEALDFETNSSFVLSVMVSDGTKDASSTITINVIDVNEAPTDISLSSLEISKNSAAGTLVGVFTTEDEDTDESFTYEIINSVPFQVAGNELRSTGVFENQDETTISVDIKSTDKGQLSLTKTFTISVEEALGDISPNQVLIFPNPTQDYLRIQIEDFNYARIMDLSGREILRSDSKAINVERLKSGTYLLLLYDNDFAFTTARFQKNRK